MPTNQPNDCSVLYPAGLPRPEESVPEPDCFADLNLDQLVTTLTAGLERYRLTRYLHDPAHDPRVVHYRHEVLADLESPALVDGLTEFLRAMEAMRDHLDQVGKRHHRLQRQRCFLDAAGAYVEAVHGLARSLAGGDLTSTALRGFLDHVEALLSSPEFDRLAADTDSVRGGLEAVTYCVRVRGSRVTVTRFEDEPDYSADVLATFERFRRATPREHLRKMSSYADVDGVEGRVLNGVAELFPDEFGALQRFCEEHADHVDPVVANFEREVQFYLSYLRFIAPLQAQGLRFSRPTVTTGSARLLARDTFDLLLARQLLSQRAAVVTNDLELTSPERVLVVSGPNQGGKTTCARSFGQLHYLASLGLPVPGSEVEVALWDELFTHFEKEEDLRELTGKLQDDVVRIHDILTRATSRSVIVLNEIFSSTTADDARLLGTAVLRQVIDRGARCACVTFIDELASLGPETVSMASTVDPDDPATRTFKVVRRPADGLAYAAAIAAKYGLTHDRLAERMSS